MQVGHVSLEFSLSGSIHVVGKKNESIPSLTDDPCRTLQVGGTMVDLQYKTQEEKKNHNIVIDFCHKERMRVVTW